MLPLLATATSAIPQPHGWLGTVNDWARGLGIAFAILDCVLLAVAWTMLRRAGVTPTLRLLLPAAVVVLPLAVTFFGYHYGFEAAKSVEACGACHAMRPYVSDLREPASQTLAAVHFKNRYIQDNQCYTCHSDYGMFGGLRAKWKGLEHLARQTTGSYSLPLTIARPYASARCLHCHGESLKFLESAGHGRELVAQMITGAVSCLGCHGPAHRAAAARAVQ
ncbi:MAG TPA: NapC/NirT family cytochrome c [Methylomirabilota bacterium]|nr:NapC/NirT family cytochrome c [Methylomirabilota bacterium]